MVVAIRHGQWLQKDFAVSTTSGFRETVILGRPDDYWTLEGSTISMSVRVSPDAPASLVDFSTVNQKILVLDAKRRRIQFAAPHTDFSAMAPGHYYYDLVVVGWDSYRYRRLAGRFNVYKGLTSI